MISAATLARRSGGGNSTARDGPVMTVANAPRDKSDARSSAHSEGVLAIKTGYFMLPQALID